MLFLLANGQNCSKIQKIPEIADDHNLGTEYVRNKSVSKCAVLDSTYNSIGLMVQWFISSNHHKILQ